MVSHGVRKEGGFYRQAHHKATSREGKVTNSGAFLISVNRTVLMGSLRTFYAQGYTQNAGKLSTAIAHFAACQALFFNG